MSTTDANVNAFDVAVDAWLEDGGFCMEAGLGLGGGEEGRRGEERTAGEEVGESVDEEREEREEVEDEEGESGRVEEEGDGGGEEGVLDPVAYVLRCGNFTHVQVEKARVVPATELDLLVKDAFFEGREEGQKVLDALVEKSDEANAEAAAAKAALAAAEAKLETSGTGVEEAEAGLALAEEEEARLEEQLESLEAAIAGKNKEEPAVVNEGDGASSSSARPALDAEEIRQNKVTLERAKLTLKASLREYEEKVKRAKEVEAAASRDVKEFRSAAHGLREAMHASRKNMGKIRNMNETMLRLGGSLSYVLRRESRAKSEREKAEAKVKEARAKMVDLELKAVATESAWEGWETIRKEWVAATRTVWDAREKLRAQKMERVEAAAEIASAQAEYTKAKKKADKFAKRRAQAEAEKEVLEQMYQYAKDEEARIAHAARVQADIAAFEKRKEAQAEAYAQAQAAYTAASFSG